MNIPLRLMAVLRPAEEGGYIALNPETGMTTEGETLEQALANLCEATGLYLREFPNEFVGDVFVTYFNVPDPQ